MVNLVLKDPQRVVLDFKVNLCQVDKIFLKGFDCYEDTLSTMKALPQDLGKDARSWKKTFHFKIYRLTTNCW